MSSDPSPRPHRWVTLITLAISEDEAAATNSADLLLGSDRARTVSPVVCFDCRQLAADADDWCTAPYRPGYPERT